MPKPSSINTPTDQIIIAQAVAIVERLVPMLIAQHFNRNPLPEPKDPEAPVSIQKVGLIAGNRLIVSLSDGQSQDAGTIETLRGPRGQNGERGPRGQRGPRGEGISKIQIIDNHLHVTFSDGIKYDVGELQRGDRGIQGLEGRGISGTRKVNNELIVDYTDGRSTNLGRLPEGIRGIQGESGPAGRDGRPGETGTRGVQGNPGVQGPSGVSVASLRIVDNPDGGGRVFETELSDGTRLYTDSIPVGPVGPEGKPGVGIREIRNDDGRATFVLSDERKISIDLPRGGDGPAGMEGRGISSLRIKDGHLVINYTDATSENIGRVVGKDGKDGKVPDLAEIELSDAAIEQIKLLVNAGLYDLHLKTNADIRDDGSLYITLGDMDFNLGVVCGKDGKDGIDGVSIPGPAGAPGERGPNGIDGRSISQTSIVSGALVIKYTDGTEHNVGPLPVGSRGPGFIFLGKWTRGKEYFSQSDNPDGPWADVITYRGASYVCMRQTKLAPPGNGWQRMFAE